MDTEVLWKELRAQQIYTRDKASFEQFDKIFLQELLDSLRIYIDTIIADIKIAGLTELLSNHEKIDQRSDLTQLQIALLHHASSIQHLSIIIHKVFEKSKKDPGSFTLFNPDNYLKVLPKLELFKEFMSDRVKRYGQYLGELQTVDPVVFRGFSLITKNAQKQFALHMFHTLVKLLPYRLSSKSIADQVSHVSATILQSLSSETPHISKYKKVWQYFKQLFKDTQFNLILNTLDGLEIDKYIGKHFSIFLASKTDNISEDCLTLHAVELADLASTLNIEITGHYFANLIKCTKSERYCQLNESLVALEKMLFLSKRELKIEQIQELINTIELLTPLDTDQKCELKDKPDCDKKLMFTQPNVLPLLRELRVLTSRYKTDDSINELTRRRIRQLLAYLEYTQAVVSKNIRALTAKLDAKITLCKGYPTIDSLDLTITDMSLLIQKNTKTNIFGRKEKNSLAILADCKRRELMNLLKARVEIQLQNQPYPDVEYWDTFLFSGSSAPLYRDSSWSNCFYAFTFTRTSPRFSALFIDQIANLNKLAHYKQSIDCIISNNKAYLPKDDHTELKKDKIVGIVHLEELSYSLAERYNKLSAYVLYLQIASISSILKYHSAKNANLNKLHSSFQSWALEIKTEATTHNYNIILPEIAILDTYIAQVSHINSQKTLIPPKTQDQIIDTLNRIKKFFYGNAQQKLEAGTTNIRTLVHVEKVNLFRQFIINFIKFIELCMAKLKKLFSKTSSMKSECPVPLIRIPTDEIKAETKNAELSRTQSSGLYLYTPLADRRKATTEEITAEPELRCKLA